MTTAIATRTIGKLNIDEVTRAPRRLTKSARLHAGQAEVFDFVRRHEAWANWFPIVEAVKVDNSQAETPDGNGCVRHCTLTNGAQFTEKIVGYEAPHQFGYAVEDNNAMGMQGHLAVVTLQAEAPQRTRLTWYQYFNHPEAETFTEQVNEILDGGIQNLIERFGGESLETVFGE
ncbi:MAG: hypothetical protein DPW09_10030 [Anaerolineae bacterium]|nr:hypothetical protein [Anaerolineae bacterium]